MKKKLIIIIIISIIILGIISFLIVKNKPTKSNMNNYIVYIKNPSIKLEISVKCIKDICEEPIVNNYQLINNEINLVNDSKDLFSYIENILNQSETKDFEILSNWNLLETYLANKGLTSKIIIQKENIINEEINKELEKQSKKNDEELKKQQEQEKIESTIKLNDELLFNEIILSFSCKNCFSTTLINTLKGSKGYRIIKSDPSIIILHKITSISNEYNSKKYFGEDLTNKIYASGGNDLDSKSNENNKLTIQVCKNYNLNCE